MDALRDALEEEAKRCGYGLQLCQLPAGIEGLVGFLTSSHGHSTPIAVSQLDLLLNGTPEACAIACIMAAIKPMGCA